MKENKQLLIINKDSAQIKKVCYKDVISLENLTLGLKRTKTNVTPGIDGETKTEITESRLRKLHLELSLQTYKPKPTKRIGIPRSDGGFRHLGIASQIDKVVQAAVLNFLEPVLEGVFKTCSFGFRPNLGCHNALREIKYQWKAITWIIKIDIKKCFERVNQDYILEKLKIYCDQSTVELVQKLIKVGYADIHNLTDRGEYGEMGIPLGSLISPILANLYLHEVDEFIIEKLVPLYNRGESRPKNPDYSKRYSYTDLDCEIVKTYPGFKQALMRTKHNSYVSGKKFAATDGESPNYRRLHYIRYADDFILGFIGPKKEADEIVEQITTKLAEIKLGINTDKSKIFHSSESGIKFLGMFIRYYTHNKIVTVSEEKASGSSVISKLVNKNKSQAVNTAHFTAPIVHMLKKLVDKGMAKIREDGTIRGTAYIRLSMLDENLIVRRYSAIIKGILNYYSCINHRSDLWKVFAVLRKSCALTLAHKLKIGSAARIFAKFGPYLKIKGVGESTELFYPTSLKSKIDFKIRSNSIQYPAVMELEIDAVQGSAKYNPKTSDKCEYENCEETTHLEQHHLNPMSNLSKRKDLTAFQKALIQRERKTVTLCKKHHNLLHSKRVLD